MTRPFTELASAYFDGLLSEAEEQQLNQSLKASDEHLDSFVQMAILHDQLHLLHRLSLAVGTSPTATISGRRRDLLRLAGASLGMALLLILAIGWTLPREMSAATELDRLISQVKLTDRSYRIVNLDRQEEKWDERRPLIHDARLMVRSPDQYLLIRKFPDGRAFITGSDGERSWSIPPTGPVRISHDPLRFRGPVPGHQQGIPFVNLRSDLVQLQVAYDIATLPRDESGMNGLKATKKSHEYRGPNGVELRYDQATGVIHRLVFTGMPRARGGPESVALELIGHEPLGRDYFTPAAHHEPGRRVVEEDQ